MGGRSTFLQLPDTSAFLVSGAPSETPSYGRRQKKNEGREREIAVLHQDKKH
jgi:hypothetical protein